MQKKFTVVLPVTKNAMVNSRLAQTNIGEIELFVSALFSFGADPEIDFDKILWNGTDVLPMIDNLPAGDELMQHFTNAAYSYIYDVLIPSMQEKEVAHA